MKPDVGRFWFVLSISFQFLARTTDGKHIHSSAKPPKEDPAIGEKPTGSSTEPTDSTIPPDELEDLFNWFDLPEGTSEIPVTGVEQEQPSEGSGLMTNSSSKYPVLNSETDSHEWMTHGSSRPTSASIEPPASTTDRQPTISELLQVLQNITTKPSGEKMEVNNRTSPLENVTSVSELLSQLAELHVEDLQDLENFTSFSNDSLVRNLLNATQEANVTTLGELQNWTRVLNTDDVGKLIAELHNISSVAGMGSVNGTGDIQDLVNQLMNVTVLGTPEGNVSGLLGSGNFTGNSTAESILESMFGENVTESESGLNETGSMIGDLDDQQEMLSIPNGTTEISRLETATNDELWPTKETPTTEGGSSEPLTTEEPITNEPITNEETTTSLTSNQSSSAEMKPEAGFVNENQSESTDKVNKWNNPYFGGLVTALVFGCLFVLILIVFVSKRFYDGYQRRHYTKMDYLVNGMYN